MNLNHLTGLSILIFCPLIAISASAKSSYFPPVEVQKMIEKSEVLNSKCRGGSGDSPATLKACDKRDNLNLAIRKKGFCYGSLNANEPSANHRWLPCKLVAK